MWQVPESLREIEDAGDDTIVRELIISFQHDTEERLARLQSALARRDCAALKHEAHSLRGSASQMGADNFAELCQSIETAAAVLDWPELEQHVGRARPLFAGICRDIEAHLQAQRH